MTNREIELKALLKQLNDRFDELTDEQSRIEGQIYNLEEDIAELEDELKQFEVDPVTGELPNEPDQAALIVRRYGYFTADIVDYWNGKVK
jgi:predicted nuclease with TOPRIM domain